MSEHVSGFRKDDIPRRYRLKVEADKFQKDWSITQLVHKIMALTHGDDIQGLLNHWVGRFSRKNYPLLIKVISTTYFLKQIVFVLIIYVGMC